MKPEPGKNLPYCTSCLLIPYNPNSQVCPTSLPQRKPPDNAFWPHHTAGKDTLPRSAKNRHRGDDKTRFCRGNNHLTPHRLVKYYPCYAVWENWWRLCWGYMDPFIRPVWSLISWDSGLHFYIQNHCQKKKEKKLIFQIQGFLRVRGAVSNAFMALSTPAAGLVKSFGSQKEKEHMLRPPVAPHSPLLSLIPLLPSFLGGISYKERHHGYLGGPTNLKFP